MAQQKPTCQHPNCTNLIQRSGYCKKHSRHIALCGWPDCKRKAVTRVNRTYQVCGIHESLHEGVPL